MNLTIWVKKSQNWPIFPHTDLALGANVCVTCWKKKTTQRKKNWPFSFYVVSPSCSAASLARIFNLYGYWLTHTHIPLSPPFLELPNWQADGNTATLVFPPFYLLSCEGGGGRRNNYSWLGCKERERERERREREHKQRQQLTANGCCWCH